MKTYTLFKPKLIWGRLVRTALILLAGMVILPVAAQFNGSTNSLFISGQLTNDLNGAPIADHDIYIFSDSLVNNGFGHYAVIKTDVNGFYADTLYTTLDDGSIQIYLYNFLDSLEEVTRYYRFIWSDTYHMIADFSIYDPDATQDLQANFKAEKDTISGNELSVIFRDLSIGDRIKSWNWDFGDSTHSTLQDPTHIYAEPGIYNVILTVSAYPNTQDYALTSSIVKHVQVGERAYYDIGGQVFTGLYPPIDMGIAYLYMVEDNGEFILLDTAVIKDYGYYIFHTLAEGKYTTKVRLQKQSAYYGQYIPTYLGNLLEWNHAEVRLVDNTYWDFDINLIHSDGIPSGKGQIVGQMLYDTSTISSPLVPAEDVEVVLLGVEGTKITCKLSDLQGNFDFPDLAFGTYQLYPDVAGVSTPPVYVSISESNPVAENFSLVISTDEVTYLGITNPTGAVENITSLYPNPAIDQIRLNISMKRSETYEVMVVDMAGHCIQKGTQTLLKGDNELNMDVSSLSPGLYQVILSSDGVYRFNGKFLKME